MSTDMNCTRKKLWFFYLEDKSPNKNVLQSLKRFIYHSPQEKLKKSKKDVLEIFLAITESKDMDIYMTPSLRILK